MTDFIRTIWQNTGSTTTGVNNKPMSSMVTAVQPVDQIRLPPSKVVTATSGSSNGLEKQRLIKLEPPASPPVSDSESHSGKAQRMARVNARRDKRKSVETVEVLHANKKLKTEAALDPNGEERLRVMEAQLEHLDPDSKEAKKKRRLIRNRMSAQLHRERKKAYVGQLEDQLQAKETQLKALQEQLAALVVESEQLKQQLSQKERMEHELQIKVEPVPLEKTGLSSVLIPEEQATVDWAVCLEDVDEVMVGEDLLCDLDESPLAAYGLHSISEDPMTTALAEEEQRQKIQAQTQSYHEIHAAKKNLAMMIAMMFSVTFCGQGETVANVTSGRNLTSMFNAVPVKELSQMSIASRIVACLEKTSWEDFQDVSSWTASAASAAAAAAVAVSAEKKPRSSSTQKPADSPSAASDVTDAGSCGSPKELKDVGMSFDTDLIEEFVYPVEEPVVPALTDTNWFGADSVDFGHSDVEGDDEPILETKTTFKPVSMTSRLYEKLTKLWNEKNQVILTVLNSKNEVIRRSVADMSTIGKEMSTRAFFPLTTAATAAASSNDKLLKQQYQSVTFLYPLSAFSEDQRSAAFLNGGTSDQVFLEVSCQINGAAKPVL